MNKKQLALFSLLITGTLGFQSTIEAKETETRRRIADHPLLAVEALSKSDKYLEEITAVSQYLFQVLQKGAIKVPDKRPPQRWLIKLQDAAKNLQRPHEDGTERALGEVLHHTNFLGNSLREAMNSQFQTLANLDTSLVEVPAEVNEPEQIDELVKKNGELVQVLQTESTTAGLTWLNRWARKVDNFNNNWGVTTILENAIRFAGVAGFAVYLMPTSWFTKVEMSPGRIKAAEEKANKDGATGIVPQPRVEESSLLSGLTGAAWMQSKFENTAPLSYIPGAAWLKSKIGTTEFIDPDGFYMLEGKEAKPIEKHTFAGFVNGPDYKSIKHLGIGALALLSNEITGSAINSIKSWIRPYWNSLKGHDMPRSTYRAPDITLDDPRLIGVDSQVTEMKKIVDYMMKPELYDRASSGLSKALLLTGPSRTGKTLIAEALGGSLNEAMRNAGITGKVGFRVLSPNDLEWSRNGIQSVIEEAKANAPCVLFLDEIHNIGGMQTKETGAANQLYHFLTGMAEALKSTNVHDTVILLAATNREFMLDDALTKPGRFMRINFEMPTVVTREKFFKVNCDLNGIGTNNLNIASLARQTENCSYGDLDQVFKAARFAAHSARRTVTQTDLEGEIIKKIFRIRSESELVLAPHARKHIAAYQAGSALMHLLHAQELPTVLEIATIRGKWRKSKEIRWIDNEAVKKEQDKEKTKYGHIVTSRVSEAIDFDSNPRLSAKILLAGAVAESILYGSTNMKYRPRDKRKALDLLEKVAFRGLSKEDFAPQELVEPMMKAKQDLFACEAEVRELLTQHKRALEEIAKALDVKTLLKADEIKEIIRTVTDSKAK